MLVMVRRAPVTTAYLGGTDMKGTLKLAYDAKDDLDPPWRIDETIFVKELDVGYVHTFKKGAPSAWAEAQGCTHSLCFMLHSLGARLLKTVAYIAVDEDAEGNAVWEKWRVRTPSYFSN